MRAELEVQQSISHNVPTPLEKRAPTGNQNAPHDARNPLLFSCFHHKVASTTEGASLPLLGLERSENGLMAVITSVAGAVPRKQYRFTSSNPHFFPASRSTVAHRGMTDRSEKKSICCQVIGAHTSESPPSHAACVTYCH
jgi:hypothetical protein